MQEFNALPAGKRAAPILFHLVLGGNNPPLTPCLTLGENLWVGEGQRPLLGATGAGGSRGTPSLRSTGMPSP